MTMKETLKNAGASRSRIPATLQMVFLASNRGKDVNKPPPERVASKVFLYGWIFGSKPKPKNLSAKSPAKREDSKTRIKPKRSTSEDTLKVG